LIYPASEHYSDDTVAMFIPKGFRPNAKVDFVVHFHGWGNTVAGTLEQFDLIRQFSESGKNAVLIVPQGPRNAPDSFGGKLEDTNGFSVFMTEAVDKLRSSEVLEKTDFAAGRVILSGHSGGYHPMAAILDHGGVPVAEAWIFDGLYGNTENFVAWQKASGGRLLNIYTEQGGTKVETEKLMADYRQRGVKFLALAETNCSPADLSTDKIVFIHSDLSHSAVIFQRGEFAQFLKTSGLADQ
jgi:hypothetical protein